MVPVGILAEGPIKYTFGEGDGAVDLDGWHWCQRGEIYAVHDVATVGTTTMNVTTPAFGILLHGVFRYPNGVRQIIKAPFAPTRELALFT
jgi:hypothetical protein